MPRLHVSVLLALATLSVSAFGQDTNQARPGTLNYVEGTASIGTRTLSGRSVGKAELQPGESLTTGNGKAEILLTPGVFARIDNNSSVKMVAPDLTHTEIALDHGRVLVEVDQIYPQNDILVDQNGGQTQLLKVGLYEFNADTNTLRVFDGKAALFPGNNFQPNQKPILVKGGREIAVNGEVAKPEGFDKHHAEDGLYNWSSLRSQYLGEANLNLATTYAGSAGFYPGWFWDAGLYGYTWLPGDGLFWNPFGFGFYSPYYIYGGGFIYGGGRYGRGGYSRGFSRAAAGSRASGGFSRGGGTGFSRGGSAGFSRGGGTGFSGGGGFHGGGGGGHR